MTTRTIVTSQPDVACDVCERRLLRGEQPDVFVAAGRRLTVCELCAPRAVHEGWMRESDSGSLSLPPARARRGRSFLERLRQVTRGAESDLGIAGQPLDEEGEAGYDFLDAATSAQPVPARPRAPVFDGQSRGDASAEAPAPPLTYAEQAVAVFNASEFPRRIAGVARSLGAPAVNVRSAEHLESVERIVVAWELCWYRYEVDLGEEPVEACVLAQGTELEELEREERAGNAVAAANGALSLT